MTRAEWHHFKETKWLMPLLSELSDWRVKLIEIEKKYESENKDFDLTFVADFNGLKLENFVSNYLNASIEVLNGVVNVEYEQKSFNNFTNLFENKKENQTLTIGQRIQVSLNIKFFFKRFKINYFKIYFFNINSSI